MSLPWTQSPPVWGSSAGCLPSPGAIFHLSFPWLLLAQLGYIISTSPDLTLGFNRGPLRSIGCPDSPWGINTDSWEPGSPDSVRSSNITPLPSPSPHTVWTEPFKSHKVSEVRTSFSLNTLKQIKWVNKVNQSRILSEMLLEGAVFPRHPHNRPTHLLSYSRIKCSWFGLSPSVIIYPSLQASPKIKEGSTGVYTLCVFWG